MADVIVDATGIAEKIHGRLENPEFGLFLAQQWKRLINPFTPHREGNLERNVAYEPFLIHYNSAYAHYMYGGIQYVDPKYGVSGFTNDGGVTWFSRPGIKKIPSSKPFNYLTDHNAQATHHWDKAAEEAGQKDKLAEIANKHLRRLG